MIKLLGMSSALRVVQDAIYIQREQPEITDREALLLADVKAKVNEIWALIRDFETDVEEGKNQ